MAHTSQTPLFRTGTAVELYVTSVQPGAGRFCHFWAQSDLEAQEEVENLMSTVESRVEHASPPQMVHCEEMCLAKFQGDGRWYRSKVVDNRPKGSRSQAKVFFIDYGNSEIVPLSDLRTNMHEFFANHPQLANEFVLADLLPSDGIHWSEKEVDYLNENLAYGEFFGHILASVCGKIPLIRLMNNDDKTQRLVAKFLGANIGKSYNNNHFIKSEYPRIEIPLSTEVLTFVTYSLSPVKFWVQLESAETELNQLRSHMDLLYGRLGSGDLVCNFIDEGTLCAGTCSIDDNFYRAVIEECHTDGVCRTYFIDYGNSETASIQNFKFKILPDELKSIPAYAFECTLAGIPPGMHMTDTHIAIFRDLVNDIVVKAKFISVNAVGVYTVALYDTDGNSVIDVMKLGSVKPYSKVVPAAVPVAQKTVHIPPAECAVGSEEEVFITMIESPDRFFGQLCKYSAENLDAFQNTLMEHYEANIARIPRLTSPSVGDYCCAKSLYSGDDDGWYRARVEGIAGNKLDLFFIDYGDRVTDIPVAEVKELDPKFFKLPQQGILLKMCTPVDKAKFKEIIDRRVAVKLEKNLEGNFYSANFSKNNEPSILQLVSDPQVQNQSPAMQRPGRYKELEIDPAKSVEVTVTHVVSPESFYCQLVSCEQSLNKLMDEIHDVYSKLGPMDGLLQSVVSGMPCVAQFTGDEFWYRASIIGNAGDKLKVFYVDYGNSEDLPGKLVRIMDPRFLLLPAQGIHCTMHGISYAGRWPPDRTKQFEEMVTEKNCTASFLGFAEKQSAYEVELLDTNHVNINEKFGNATRTLHVARVAPTPAVQIPTPRSPQRRAPGLMYNKLDLEIGKYKDVAVVHTENPSEFYCQLSECAPALNDLMDKIEAVYAKLGPTDHGVRNPVKGMPCCAKFTEDDVWYRAEITEVLGNIITVQFVDYGNGESLTSERVKELKPEFLRLEAQAIRCCLKGVAPDGDWSDAAIDRFTDLTDEKTLVGSLLGRLPDGTIEMELIDTESDVNVAREIKKMNVSMASVMMPPPVNNANIVRSRSSSGSSSSSRPSHQISPPKQKVSPRQSQSSNVTGATGNRSFGNRQPAGRTNDWVEEAPTNRFLDRLAGGDEQPYRRPEWPGEGKSRGNSFGSGEGRSYGNDRGSESRSFVRKSDPGPVPPYEDINLSVGKRQSVLIKWNETTTDFWCQLLENQGEIEKMMISIQKEYSRNRSDYELREPSVGSPCMALYAADRSWYRGKVTSVDARSCKVHFVDYGNEEEVQKTNVLRMKTDFMALPVQGIRCHLKGVKPVAWSADSKRKYQKIMMEAEPLDCLFKEKNGANWIVETQVISTLISADLVQSTSPASVPTPVDRGATVRDGAKKYKIPNKSGRHQGFISQLDSPGKFFIQLQNEEALVGKITDELVKICEGPGARALKVNNAPAVGAACIAKYADDGSHYRAVVESIAGSKAGVRFVDFGNADTVDLNEILEIGDSLLHQVPLAYECTFAAGSEWTEADADRMHSLTGEKELVVEFITTSPPFVVKLFDGQTDIGSHFQPKPAATVTAYAKKKVTSAREMGYVSHIENLNKFYMQLESEEDALNTLSNQLQESYEAGSSPLAQPAVGIPCVTRFSEDNAWYRAVITSVSGGKAAVRFVDYGNGEDVNVKDLQSLKPEFANMPPFAVECSLQTGRSSPEDTDKFSELTDGKLLTFAFSSSDPYVVKVFEGETNLGAAFTSESTAVLSFPKRSVTRGTSHDAYVPHVDNTGQFFLQFVSEENRLDAMTTALTQFALADLPEVKAPKVGSPCVAELSADNALYRAEITELSPDRVKVHFIDFGDADNLPLSKVRSIPADLVNEPPMAIKCSLEMGNTSDQAAVEKFTDMVMDVVVKAEFLTDTSPYKVKLSVDGVDVKDSLGMAPAQAYTLRDAPKMQQKGYTSYVESVNKFYIQLASDENDLESLSEELNSICEGLSPVTSPAAGTVCGSKFTEDEMWYRAEVLSVLPGNKVEVVFVDYGNRDTVDIGSLRTLTAELLQKPVLAFECRLDVEVTTNEDNTEKLTNMTVDQELNVEFSSSSKPFRVRLCVDGKDVVESLSRDASRSSTAGVEYPSYNLKANKEKAHVCHVESPGQFYIQLVEDESKLNELMDQLDGCCAAKVEVLPEVKEGVACVCKYSADDGWYRGKVTAKCDDMVTVQFVDYGNSEDKALTEVYSLASQFFTLPPFALECTIGKGDYSDADTDKFFNLTQDKELTVTFISQDKPYTVQVLDGETDLATMFKMEGPAEVTSPGGDVKKYKEQVLTVGCHKGYVSHVESLTEFYIQFESEEDALNTQADELDHYYSSALELPLGNVAEGAACATLYSEDGHWYRGEIVALNDDLVTVQFIDYGNTEQQARGAVKELADRFSSLAPLSYRCSIGDGAVFTPEDCDAFTEQTAEKLLAVEFLTAVSPYIVKVSEDTECLTSKYFPDKPEVLVTDTAPSTTQIPPMSVPSDSVGVHIAQADSPARFFLQLASAETDLHNLMDKIEAADRQLFKGEITAGCTCLAKYSEDESLYRAAVASVKGDQISVLFVDYGNSEEVNKDDLFTLGADLASIPRFAIQCELSGISWPVGQKSENFEAFMEKELTATFDTKTEPCSVTLLDGAVDLKDLFTIHDEVSEPSPDAGPSAEVPNIKHFKHETFLEGSTNDCYVSITKSPGQFWCQKASCEENLAELTDQVLADDTLIPATLTADDIQIGSAYMAKFAEDACWYRALLLKKDPAACDVLFVDYGNQETVPYENIAAIKDEYLVMEACAVECFLDGAVENWSQEATEKFSSLVAEQIVETTCVSVTTSRLVKGLNKFAVSLVIDGASILEALIKEGLATAATSEEPSSESVLEETEAVDLHYTSTQVDSGNKYEVIVPFITSPSQFWIQRSDAQSSLDELMEQIENAYAGLGDNDRALLNPTVGQPCAVKFSEDHCWYRGQIKKLLEDGRVEVFFVDYGNSEETELSSVKKLQPDLLKQPMHALECFHAGLKSIEGPWSSEAMNTFSDLVHEKTLLCEVLSQGTDCDTPHIVQLLDMGISVVNKMVEAGVAERTAEELTHFLDESLVEPNAASLPDESGPAAEEVCPDHVDATGEEAVAAADAVQVEPSKVESRGHYVEYKIPELDADANIDVFVTSANSPADFWCQLAVSSEDLPLLMDTFHEYCHDNDDAKLEEELVEGLPCIACRQDGEDEAWYRAKVIQSRPEEEQVDVCFVDYGNTETLPKSNLYKLKQEHAELPLQAFKCSLEGVQPVGDAWDPSACTRFEEMVYDKKLKLEVCRIQESDSILIVHGCLREGDESILTKLIEEGYADELRDVGSVESEKLNADDVKEVHVDEAIKELDDAIGEEDSTKEPDDIVDGVREEKESTEEVSDNTEADLVEKESTHEADDTTGGDVEGKVPVLEVEGKESTIDAAECEREEKELTQVAAETVECEPEEEKESTIDAAECEREEKELTQEAAETVECAAEEKESTIDAAECEREEKELTQEAAESVEYEEEEKESTIDAAECGREEKESTPEAEETAESDVEEKVKSQATEDATEGDVQEKVTTLLETEDDTEGNVEKKLTQEDEDTAESEVEEKESNGEAKDTTEGEVEKKKSIEVAEDMMESQVEEKESTEVAEDRTEGQVEEKESTEEAEDRTDGQVEEEESTEEAEDRTDGQVEEKESTEEVDNSTAADVEEKESPEEVEDTMEGQIEEKESTEEAVDTTEGQVEEKKSAEEVDNSTAADVEEKESTEKLEDTTEGDVEEKESTEGADDATDGDKEEKDVAHEADVTTVGDVEEGLTIEEEDLTDGHNEQMVTDAAVEVLDDAREHKESPEIDMNQEHEESNDQDVDETGAGVEADSGLQEAARKTVENAIKGAREVLKSESDVSDPQESGKIPLLEVAVNDEMIPVVFTAGASPNSFYLQLKSSSESLAKLNQDIASYCEKEEIAETTWSVDDACLGFGDDGLWCRAKITGKHEDEDMYQLFFVDSGMDATLPADKIRSLPDEFRSLPSQGVHCQLAGLMETTCNDDVMELFKGMCKENLLGKFVKKDEDGSYTVHLYEGGDDINKRLEEKFGCSTSSE